MGAVHVVVDGGHERLGRHLKLDQLPIIHTTTEWTIDLMRQGMKSGRSSLMVLIPVRVNGGNAVVAAEISLNSWMMATAVLRGACRDEIEEPGWANINPAARALLLPRFAESITRAVPTATVDQALEAAGMMLDAIGADAPPDAGEAG